MTTYRLAHTPMDYRRCRALLAERNATNRLRFPTVIALRNDRLVALLGTEAAYTDRIVAGPLVVAKDIANPAFLTVRLIDAYEGVMRRAGVKAYLFCTPVANDRFVTWLASLGGEPFERKDEHLWYLRSVA